MKQFVITLMLLVSLAFSVSCSGGHRSAGSGRERDRLFTTPVADILNNPQQYAHRSVTVRGEVWNPVGVGKLTVFTLSDRSGEIAVYSSSSMAPSEGTVLKVTGTVHLVYRFGDHSLCYIKQNP